MADVQTTDINTKPTVTAIDSNDQIYISDGGTALKKISYTNLAKAIIEQYNASQLAGATKTIQAAFNELNSKLFKQLGANLSDEAFNALTADGLYVGYIPTTSCPCKQQWAYINVKSLSANANDVMQEVIGITSAITCTRMKNNGTWGNWVLAPTRAEVDALNSKILPSTNYTGDLNNAPEGVVYTSSGVTNAPVAYDYWFVHTMKTASDSASASQYAIARTGTNPPMYYRAKSGGTWTSWTLLAKQSDVDTLNSNKQNFSGVINDTRLPSSNQQIENVSIGQSRNIMYIGNNDTVNELILQSADTGSFSLSRLYTNLGPIVKETTASGGEVTFTYTGNRYNAILMIQSNTFSSSGIYGLIFKKGGGSSIKSLVGNESLPTIDENGSITFNMVSWSKAVLYTTAGNEFS